MVKITVTMHNRLILSLLMVVFAFQIKANSLLIDFSKSTHTFTGFGGATFQVTQGPSNPLNFVGEINNAGSDPWEGVFLSLPKPVSFDSLRIFEIDAYVNASAGEIILLKFEDGTQANIELTDTISQSGWQTLTFDFNKAKLNYLDNNTFQASGEYSKIVLFLNGGTPYQGSILIDNIRGGTQGDPYTLDTTFTTLVWSDEFDDNGAVNSDKWHHQTKLPAGGSWFNGEQQHYTNRTDNSFVENGFLKIVAKNETFNDQGYTKNYTSARLNSKYAFQYGRVDVRAKLPLGAGTWPAIWTLGKNITEDGGFFNDDYGTTPWPACGEIDIMEHWGNNQGVVHGSLHTPSSFGATQNTGTIIVPTVSDSFHVYSMNWSPQQIAFLVNGEIYYVYDPSPKNQSTWPFNAPQYLLLNIAMGGVGGTIDPNFTQSEMVIDYVRVYQNTGGVSTENTVKESDDFFFFPNPSNDFVTFSKTPDKVAVFDYAGKLISQKVPLSNIVSFAEVEAGLYIMQIEYEGKIYTKKLMKH